MEKSPTFDSRYSTGSDNPDLERIQFEWHLERHLELDQLEDKEYREVFYDKKIFVKTKGQIYVSLLRQQCLREKLENIDNICRGGKWRDIVQQPVVIFLQVANFGADCMEKHHPKGKMFFGCSKRMV